MFIDTHCHLNMIIKKEFDVLLTELELTAARPIIAEAHANGVSTIINVGTSLPESANSIALAKKYSNIFATIGIHPNDCTQNWRTEMQEIKKWLHNKEENKIVGVGECGLDYHYPDYDAKRQYDAFKMQIELSLEYECALVVHSRDAYQETLRVLEEYKNQITRGIIHCFSYDQLFADQVIEYPKNELLRNVATTIPLENMVLETDAPFLPLQSLRGNPNHPRFIKEIAEYIAQLRNVSVETIAQHTTRNAQRIFGLQVE
jgi:TatD DNase family protein